MNIDIIATDIRTPDNDHAEALEVLGSSALRSALTRSAAQTILVQPRLSPS
jgi:hypothetical protein